MQNVSIALAQAVTAMGNNVMDMLATTIPGVATVAGVGLAIRFTWGVVRRFIA